MSEDFEPDWASPPWRTIQDISIEKGIPVEVYAPMLGLTESGLVKLQNGEMIINSKFAEQLSKVMGPTKEFWLNREIRYRASLNKIHLDRIAELEQELGQMRGYGWCTAAEQQHQHIVESQWDKKGDSFFDAKTPLEQAVYWYALGRLHNEPEFYAEPPVTGEQLVINRAHKLILAADRHLSECGGLIPAMLKEYYEVRAALEEQGG